MSELLFDVTRLLARGLKGRLPTGIDRVDLAYVGHYGDRARAVVQAAGMPWVLSRNASVRLFDRLASFRLRSAAALSPLLAGAPAGLQALPDGAVYLNTSHSGLLRDGYATRLARNGIQRVWMVHDLIPITHPEYCRAGESGRHRTRVTSALRHASALLTNSRDTLQRLDEYARRQGLPMPPARAVPLAPCLEPKERAPRLLDAPYFLAVGTIEPRKNLALLLQVWQRLAERHGGGTPRLVIVGQRGWECENVVDLLERSEALRGLVLERPRCTDEELAAWMRHAQALLFPSFVEGFGLPLQEALHHGTPVIASDLAVFRETGYDFPDYLDPLDGPAWLRRIEQYAATESAERAAQLERLSRFRPTSWRDHFRAVDAFVEEIAGRRVPAGAVFRRA